MVVSTNGVSLSLKEYKKLKKLILNQYNVAYK